MQDVVFAALLVVQNDLNRDPGAPGQAAAGAWAP